MLKNEYRTSLKKGSQIIYQNSYLHVLHICMLAVFLSRSENTRGETAFALVRLFRCTPGCCTTAGCCSRNPFIGSPDAVKDMDILKTTVSMIRAYLLYSPGIVNKFCCLMGFTMGILLYVFCCINSVSGNDILYVRFGWGKRKPG